MNREELIKLLQSWLTTATDDNGNPIHVIMDVDIHEIATEIIKSSLPPAEGAEDLKQYMTNLLYSAYDKGAKQIEPPESERIELDKWVEEMINGIDEYFKSEQPTAEGAEEILASLETYYDFKFHWVERDRMIRAMQEFATLHAQKIADKMVEDELVAFLIKRDYPHAMQDECVMTMVKHIVDEYLKSREK